MNSAAAEMDYFSTVTFSFLQIIQEVQYGELDLSSCCFLDIAYNKKY